MSDTWVVVKGPGGGDNKLVDGGIETTSGTSLINSGVNGDTACATENDGDRIGFGGNDCEQEIDQTSNSENHIAEATAAHDNKNIDATTSEADVLETTDAYGTMAAEKLAATVADESVTEKATTTTTESALATTITPATIVVPGKSMKVKFKAAEDIQDGPETDGEDVLIVPTGAVVSGTTVAVTTGAEEAKVTGETVAGETVAGATVSTAEATRLGKTADTSGRGSGSLSDGTSKTGEVGKYWTKTSEGARVGVLGAAEQGAAEQGAGRSNVDSKKRASGNDIDTSYLTQDERLVIMDVLKRNEELVIKDRERIRGMREDVRALRMFSVSRDSYTMVNICVRCRARLGRLFNRGSVCPRCQLTVCSKCRAYGASFTHWVCVYCMKQIQFDGRSGRWFYSHYPHSRRSKLTNEALTAADILKTLLEQVEAAAAAALRKPQRQQAAYRQQSGGRGATMNGHSGRSSNASVRSSSSQLSRLGSFEDGSATLSRGATFPRLKHSKVSKLGSASNLRLFSSSKESLSSITSTYTQAGEENYGRIEVRGEIQFGVAYDYTRRHFNILVGQCRNLAAVDLKKNLSHPYVKSYLLPDKSKTGKRKTRVKKNTLNPKFDEVLRYKITREDLEQRTLCLLVCNNDRLGRNDFLGEVRFNLAASEVLNNPDPKWYRLQERSPTNLEENQDHDQPFDSELDVGLKFVPSDILSLRKGAPVEGGELQILVKRARHLTAVRSTGEPNAFCRVNMYPEKKKEGEKAAKIKKSGVVEKSCSPAWNYTFVFEGIDRNSLPDVGVEVTVWDHEVILSNDFLGGCRFNLGTGLCNDDEVGWMDATEQEAVLWQELIDSPNQWVEGRVQLRKNMNSRFQ